MPRQKALLEALGGAAWCSSAAEGVDRPWFNHCRIDPFSACGFQPLCPQFHGVLWKHGAIMDIGTLGKGLESGTTYVNNSGAVVGFSTINEITSKLVAQLRARLQRHVTVGALKRH
jgi:hypothetical protein